VGSSLDEETLEKVSKICRDSCNPIDDKRGTIDYRTKVAGVLFKRATLLAADRIRGN
jgi:carbon-monoxide dehydrogenase medium subunit